MMKVGLKINDMVNIGEKIKQTAELGIHSCQIGTFDTAFYADRYVDEVREACEKYDMSISTHWAGWSGPKVWNFTEGPVTLGLVPAAYRRKRVEELKQGADFAEKLNIKQIATHMGFIPENPHDPEFAGLMDAIREVAEYCAAKDMKLLFETGQETPIALMRAFEVVGTGNLGLNMDTANVILYGKSNPVDMIRMMGKYVFDLHIKDGKWPTDGWNLGVETAIGEGDVDFPEVIRLLKSFGYTGALTIEREIEGEQQIRDVLKAKELLEKLVQEV